MMEKIKVIYAEGKERFVSFPSLHKAIKAVVEKQVAGIKVPFECFNSWIHCWSSCHFVKMADCETKSKVEQHYGDKIKIESLPQKGIVQIIHK